MKRAMLYGLIIFEILIIVSLLKGVQVSKQATKRIGDLEREKARLQELQAQIKEEAKYIESDFYLEKVAREELHLSKPGETIVIIPGDLVVGDEMDRLDERREEKENWQKWWGVLSGKM
jgi:cell division protein FtsB